MKIFNRIILTIALTLYISTLSMTVVYAWDQPTHQQINQEALLLFNKNNSDLKKYKDAPIDFLRYYYGEDVSSTTLFQHDFFKVTTIQSKMKHYTAVTNEKKFSGWVIRGGHTADEPQGYMAVRHFYDPLKLSGVHYITDHSKLHQEYFPINPKIDAKEWALKSPSNAFNYLNALKYYKKAMEIPYGETDKGITYIGQDFRELKSMTFYVDEHLRDYYLAKSFRALGETMHMLSDMTMPAHVRNDSHPLLEPIEQGMNPSIVNKYARDIPPIDVDLSGNTDMIFNEVAKYTNRNFFSADTFFDIDNPKGIFPQNSEIPYMSPLYGDLIWSVNKTKKTGIGSKYIQGVKVNMVHSNGEIHFMPSIFAESQGQILMPLAINASAKLIDMFFPTMTLSSSYEEVQVPKDDELVTHAYELNAIMNHDVKLDKEWSEAGLSIKYAGEGTLYRIRKGNVEEIAKLAFENGEISMYQEPGSIPLIKGKPKLLMTDKGKKAIGKGANYYLMPSDSVFVEVKAGGRIFKTDPIVFNEYELKLNPRHYEGTVGSPIKFKGFMASQPNNMVVRWSFGDGTVQSSKELSCTYSYNAPGEYDILVEVFNSSNFKYPVAKQTGTVTISESDILTEISKTNNLFIEYYTKGADNKYKQPMQLSKPSKNYKFVWNGNKFSMTDSSSVEVNGNDGNDVKFKQNITYKLSVEGELDSSGSKIKYIKYNCEGKSIHTTYNTHSEFKINSEIKDIPLKTKENGMFEFYLGNNLVTTDNIKYNFKKVYRDIFNNNVVDEDRIPETNAVVRVMFGDLETNIKKFPTNFVNWTSYEK